MNRLDYGAKLPRHRHHRIACPRPSYYRSIFSFISPMHRKLSRTSELRQLTDRSWWEKKQAIGFSSKEEEQTTCAMNCAESSLLSNSESIAWYWFLHECDRKEINSKKFDIGINRMALVESSERLSMRMLKVRQAPDEIQHEAHASCSGACWLLAKSDCNMNQ